MSSTKDPRSEFVPADECKSCGKTLKRLFGEYEDCPTCTPQATKPVDELDDKLHQILDDFYDEPFIDALPIAKKQIKALLTEARIDELEQLPLDGLQDQCFIDLRKRIDKRLAQLKNERSNK